MSASTSPSTPARNPHLSADWLSNALLLANTTVKKIKQNQEDLKELCLNTVGIMAIVREQIAMHGDKAAVKFMHSCLELEGLLQEVLNAVAQLQNSPRGFRGRLKEVLKLASVADEIIGYRMRIQEPQANFVVYIFIPMIHTFSEDL
ncbi:hypothetical protein B0H19DRAFT_1386764 [Mycena capillaripes]|nr:hypothetical protein B0H19DRAFT_1386764 [Mycena capillaripes]